MCDTRYQQRLARTEIAFQTEHIAFSEASAQSSAKLVRFFRFSRYKINRQNGSS
jgi:hypothetical protein